MASHDQCGPWSLHKPVMTGYNWFFEYKKYIMKSSEFVIKVQEVQDLALTYKKLCLFFCSKQDAQFYIYDRSYDEANNIFKLQ